VEGVDDVEFGLDWVEEGKKIANRWECRFFWMVELELGKSHGPCSSLLLPACRYQTPALSAIKPVTTSRPAGPTLSVIDFIFWPLEKSSQNRRESPPSLRVQNEKTLRNIVDHEEAVLTAMKSMKVGSAQGRLKASKQMFAFNLCVYIGTPLSGGVEVSLWACTFRKPFSAIIVYTPDVNGSMSGILAISGRFLHHQAVDFSQI